MKKMFAAATLVVTMFAALAACVDYAESPVARDSADASVPSADASVLPSFGGPTSSAAPDAGTVDASPPDAGNPCDSLSYRGATSSGVVCPGTTSCSCGGGDVCCMQKIDALAGVCTSLGTCRTLALQCDGPEDCDGGACCLEARSGGGTSCRSAASCTDGQSLCRGDQDCVNAPAGPHCTPLDLGMPGIDDVGLDGIIGTCGK